MTETKPDTDIDYKLMALDMTSLVDEIEKHADDADRVRGLCQIRFQIAEKAGLEVKFLGPGEVGHG